MTRARRPAGHRARAPKRAREASRARIAIGQAWIEPLADDPEVMSAFAVARQRLAAGRALQGLRRMRIFELSGPLPERDALAELLHRSTQFYNPAKERCSLRLDPDQPSPLAANEVGLLVVERGGARRPAAERWWRHETGKRVEIKEGVAWLIGLEPGAGLEETARELAVLKDREHGLLVNPHWQDESIAASGVPLPWIEIGTRRTASKRAMLGKTARARRSE